MAASSEFPDAVCLRGIHSVYWNILLVICGISCSFLTLARVTSVQYRTVLGAYRDMYRSLCIGDIPMCWCIVSALPITSRKLRLMSYHSYSNYTPRCSFVPLLLLLTLTTLGVRLNSPKLTNSSLPLTPTPACSLLVDNLPFTQRLNESVSSLDATYPSMGIRPLSQIEGDYLASIPSLSLVFSMRPVPSQSSNLNKQRLALVFLMLILGGDVQTNPGPTKFPYATCQRPVANNHRAMGCDNCGAWVHIKCCGVTLKQYNDYLLGVGLADWKSIQKSCGKGRRNSHVMGEILGNPTSIYRLTNHIGV